MMASRFSRQLGAAMGLWLSLALISTVQGQEAACGTIKSDYGPFDYRTQRDKLKVVEKYHFTPSVESLRGGASTQWIAGDISYLLAASPNHHRGLLALMRLAERERSPQPQHMRYSVDCYFDRAIRFQRDDTTVRMLYSQYLHKNGRTPEAMAQLQMASSLAKENGFTNYNIGLVYFEMGQYDLALTQAHKAKALGFDQPELVNLLKSKNHWKEPAN